MQNFLQRTRNLIYPNSHHPLLTQPRLYFFIKFLLIASIILQRGLIYTDDSLNCPLSFVMYHLAGLLILFLLEIILYNFLLKKEQLRRFAHMIFFTYKIIFLELIVELGATKWHFTDNSLLFLVPQEMLFTCILTVIFTNSELTKSGLLIFTTITIMFRVSPILNGIFYTSWGLMALTIIAGLLVGAPEKNKYESRPTKKIDDFSKLENKTYGVAILTKHRDVVFMNGVFKGIIGTSNEREAIQRLIRLRRFETYPEVTQQTILQQIKYCNSFDPNLKVQKTQDDSSNFTTFKTMDSIKRRDTKEKPTIMIKRPTGLQDNTDAFTDHTRRLVTPNSVASGNGSPRLVESTKLLMNTEKVEPNYNDSQDLPSAHRHFERDLSSIKIDPDQEFTKTVGYTLNGILLTLSDDLIFLSHKQRINLLNSNRSNTDETPIKGISDPNNRDDYYFSTPTNSKSEKILAVNPSCEGRVCIYEIIFTPIISEQLLVSLRDVTYEMKARDLQESNQYKDRLLKFVSHEFRTPLNCSIISLNMLKPMVSRDLDKNFLSPALYSSQLLLCLVNDILDYSQMQARKLRVTICSCDVKMVLHDVITMMELQASARRINLKLDWDQRISRTYYTDGNRLKQIILNLVSNALKFTLEGSITIKTTYIDASSCRLEVIDTGVGISEENLEVLFSEFGKIQENIHLNPQGVGLGLVISKLLSQELGADGVGLRVKSEVGVGTTFYFSLGSKIEALDGEFENTDLCLSDEEQTATFVPVLQMDRIKKLANINKPTRVDPKRKTQGFTAKAKTSGPKQAHGDEEEAYTMKFTHLFSKKTFSDLSSLFQSEPISKRKKRHHHHHQDKAKQLMSGMSLGVKRWVSTGTLSNSDDEESPTLLKKIFKKLNKNCRCPKILLVDDNAFNLTALKMLLQGFGIESTGVIDGELAIQEVADNEGHNFSCRNFAMIFMDVEMPRMDGFETAKALRKMMMNKEISYIPIIGISGHNPQEKRVECLLSGMNDMVSKPVTPAVIQDLVKRWVTP